MYVKGVAYIVYPSRTYGRPPRCNDDDAGALSVLRSFVFTSVTKKTFFGPQPFWVHDFYRLARDGTARRIQVARIVAFGVIRI